MLGPPTSYLQNVLPMPK